MTTAIVDSGCANIASVGFALTRLGAPFEVTRDAATIARASRVIIPGVGGAQYAMAALKAFGLVPCLRALSQPVMGICLGMQLLARRSAEGPTDAFGVCDMEVERLNTAQGVRVPHMGWSRIQKTERPGPLLDGVDDGSYLHFFHSYALPIGPQTTSVANSGSSFSATIQAKNFFGCQFHPERSGDTGAKILKNFLEL